MTSTRSTVNDGSTAWLTVAFYDKDGALEVPSEIKWTVVDVASGTVLVDPTIVGTPASQIELTLSATVNTMQGSGDKETRRVTVQAAFSGSQAQTKEFEYDIVNLEQIPIS